MNKSLQYFIFISLFFASASCFSQPASIAGYYRTIDDRYQPRSIIKLYQVGNEVQGRLVKILPVPGKDMTVCSQCKGNLKNRPLVGMIILSGLKQQGNEWVDGTILDVDSGKTYHCSITLSNNGHVLHFYAYVGPFGKTLDWHRVK